jgi:hypothetical protein
MAQDSARDVLPHLGYLALMPDWASEKRAEERERIARQGHEEVMAKHAVPV